MNDIRYGISKNTKRRLLLLLDFLERTDKSRFTSLELSALLGCKDTLLRKDFEFLEIPRGDKSGYDAAGVRNAISRALNPFGTELQAAGESGVAGKTLAVEKRLCIVGLGRLGAALLDDAIFEKSGFKVCAGFDSSLNRVELMRSTFELYPASRIETVLPQRKIEYAVLCCPESEAEKMVTRLVNAGIKGIVNYTRAVLKVPAGVKVENVSPVLALQMCI